MKVAIIQHEDSTPPGTTLDWLELHDISFKTHKLFEKDQFPQINDFDFLIICGGSMNVDQTEKFPWLVEEKKLILEAIQAQKKILGLCLGAQLLAESLGAQVNRHSVTELGWFPIHFVPDSPVSFSKTNLDVFQYHSYTFEIPLGAQLLATSTACHNQAFLYKNQILGFQFHPETNLEWAKECAEDPDLPTGPYCQKSEELINQFEKQSELQKWYFNCLDYMLEQKHG